MLTESELEIMNVLGKIDIAYARDISILVGAKEFTATRKRLATLRVKGMIAEEWRQGKKVYYLTKNGISQIETSLTRAYNPKGYTTDHALYIAELAAYVHLKHGISLESMYFEQEMKDIGDLKPMRETIGARTKGDKAHAPDLIIGDRCYEVELTQKSKTRLKENFTANSKHFSRQVWLIPQRLQSLRRSLVSLGEKHQCQTSILTVERMEEALKNINLKENNRGEELELQIRQTPKEKNIWEGLT